jgi:hypothetical protein
MRKLTPIALGAIAAALVLAACGSDDANSQDEDDITAAIEFAAASGDPAACTEAQTQAFNEQTTGETGAAATKSCEEDTEHADEAEVSNIEVDGDSATADAAITGASLDGQTISLALVKDADEWKLNEVTAFAEFDRDAFNAAFEEGFTSDPEVAPEAADCVQQQFAALSDQGVQDFFLGNAGKQADQEIFGPCAKFFGE